MSNPRRPMDPEIKAQWIAALRSSNYRQGRTALKRVVDGVPQYCCLGVLSDLWVQAHDVNWEVSTFGIETIRSMGTLPPSHVFEWAGGKTMVNDLALINMNDLYCATFDQIANAIESYVDRDA